MIMLILASLINIVSSLAFYVVEKLAFFAASGCDEQAFKNHLVDQNMIRHCYMFYTLPPAVVFLSSIIISIVFIIKRNGKVASIFSIAPFVICRVLFSIAQWHSFSK